MSRQADSEQLLSGGGIARYFVEHREVGWMAFFAVLIWGVLSYRSLPQQEDPILPERIARVVCVLPGATALRVEELVTRRLEKKIAEVETIDEMSSQSRANVVVITLGQRPDRVAKVEQEWDKLRAKLAEVVLPEGCSPPQLQTDFGDVVTLLLAVTGSETLDRRALGEATEALEDELKQLPSVGRTRQLGAVGETVELLFSPDTINQLGLSLSHLIGAVQERNALRPGGTLRAGAKDVPVQLASGIRDERELRGVIVGTTKQGLPIHLGDALDVRRSDDEATAFHVDVLRRASANGALQRQRAVMLAVEMKSGHIIGNFAQAVHAAIARLRPQLAPGIEVVTISDQPQSVEQRIRHFSECFGEAVIVVVIVALLLMEWRAALVVALAIPLTVAMTVGGMQLAGIPLHQISIAALIIALGMLVDDPVVATDGINREIADGRPRLTAAWLGPWKLRRPIFFATLINIFAFLPLVLLPGDKKFFIYALPVVVTLSLIASRVVSMTFIPMLGYYLLRGQRGFDQGGEVRRWFPFSFIDRTFASVLPIYRKLLENALRRPWLTIVFAYGLLAGSLALAPRLGRQFFPPAERNQMLVDLALPQSASLAETRRVCGEVARLLAAHEEIVSGAIFVGGSAPRFYYNVTPKAPDDHLAQVLLNTRRADDVPALIRQLRAELDRAIPEVRCVVKQLEQGPPIDTPIQLRLRGSDLEVLRGLADQISAALREAGGYKVHDDLGERTPTLDLVVDEARASALGVVDAATGATVSAAFGEVKITELRTGGHLLPVLLRLRPEERGDATTIRDLQVESLRGALVPLGDFAAVDFKPEFATVSHFGQQRAVTVKAYARFGELPSAVLAKARPAIEHIKLPAGYLLEYAGEAKELTQSREEMARVMAISLALIAVAMVIQFNSVMKSFVVMLTVPLGLIGALAGLTLFHASLGFMAMLAVVSLAGVIVSHIIVLFDFIEEARAEGVELQAALIHAGLVRMRPVLVTVLATAGGLIPLALTGGELWRPLTSVHIFGLLVATILTLFLLPVLYYLFAARLRWFR